MHGSVSPPLHGHPTTLRVNHPGRDVAEVAQYLPPNGRITLQQPPENFVASS
jgi:hypothetical protein